MNADHTPSRIITPTEQPSEAMLDNHVRPAALEHYVGQDDVCAQMRIFIQAARERGDALDHVLLFGPPGLGKTTLAHIISHEMGGQLKQSAGPIIEKSGDLAALLTQLESGDVLFIDEIHRLAPAIEEILYPAMEDFQLDIIIGEGPAARSIKLDLPPFTLVGATTRAGSLTSPLRGRFGIVQRLEFYQVKDLTAIIERAARILSIGINTPGAAEIARRSRGTPRIANRLLRRVRDYAQVQAQPVIDQATAHHALTLLNVDESGLDTMDHKLLHTLTRQFAGGPVGVESLAAAMSEERNTIEDVIEPYLLQEGFLQRTPRGRLATEKCYHYLGLNQPNNT